MLPRSIEPSANDDLSQPAQSEWDPGPEVLSLPSESEIPSEFNAAAAREAPAEFDDKLLRSFDASANQPHVPRPPVHQPYEGWALVLGTLVILAAIAISFLVGSRVGWLRSSAHVVAPIPAPAVQVPASGETSEAKTAVQSTKASPPKREKPKNKPVIASENAALESGELIVYDKDKVVYRSQPTSDQNPVIPGPAKDSAPADNAGKEVSSAVVPAASKARISSPRTVWLAPDEAEDRLVRRVEPQYPPDALADHRSGSVVLEVNVAEDGRVSSVRTLIGDPLLATAASQAVRTWRYQPYQSNERPSPFQTDVTLTFSLPN